MEARVASVLNGIARSMAPGGLEKALSFRVVELALRDDDAVRSHPPARGQQWALQQCLVPEMVAERVVEVPKIMCHEFFEAVKGVPQERISERTETSIQDRPLQRTVKPAQIMEKEFEVRKIVVLPERFLETFEAVALVPRERVQQTRCVRGA